MAEDADGQMKLDFGRTADRIYINAKTSVTLMETPGRRWENGLIFTSRLHHCRKCDWQEREKRRPPVGRKSRHSPNAYGCGPARRSVCRRVSSESRSKGRGIGYTEEASPTLMSQHCPAVVYGYTQSGYGEFKEGVGTLKKSRGAAGGGSETLAVIMERIAAAVKYRVRRLTPLECERLDGLPDEWTRYGASGKEMSDNARYMALGNSIAVPCAERVFIGIKKAESEE